MKYIFEEFDFNTVKKDNIHNRVYKDVLKSIIYDFINAIKEEKHPIVDLSNKIAIYAPKDKQELLELLLHYIKVYSDLPKINFNWLDVSNITDMTKLFFNFDKFEKVNFDVSKWDVSHVTNMNHMFFNCTKFNGNLGLWDVSNVTDMEDMFYGCEKFKGIGLNKWNVSNVRRMNSMFSNCQKLNVDLSKWNVGNVNKFTTMFANCESFNCDLSNWNVNVELFADILFMFKGCLKFNSDLTKWTVNNEQIGLWILF